MNEQEKKRKNIFKDNPDDEYIGNIFGWKTSIAGLIIISGFVLLYFILASNNSQKANIQETNVIDSTEILNNN